MNKKVSSESVVKDILRKTRKKYSSGPNTFPQQSTFSDPRCSIVNLGFIFSQPFWAIIFYKLFWCGLRVEGSAYRDQGTAPRVGYVP